MNPNQDSKLTGAGGSGGTISYAGDFNDDGLSDILIGAFGIAYVAFGQKGAPYRVVALVFRALDMTLASLGKLVTILGTRSVLLEMLTKTTLMT